MSDADPSEKEVISAGEHLRVKREKLGVPLEEVARVTRIARGYLKALEDDDYDRLPSAAYAKGFLRVYAQYLGLNEEDVLELYRCRVSPNLFTEQAEEFCARKAKKFFFSKIFQKRTRYLTISGMVLSAAILFLAMYGRYGGSDGKEPVEHVLPASAKPLPGSHETILPNEPTSKPSDGAAKAKNIFNQSLSMEKGSILRLKAVKDGSLDITIDDMVSQHYDLKVGDIIEWKGQQQFSLDLEDAGGVEAKLNGRTLDPLGEQGIPVHVVLKAERTDSDVAP